jgi:DNA modification methylase
MTNHLYYGDNLDVLRESIRDETVDLIYLDPPFNSNATYNILFKAPSGEASQAQIEAFEDTWHWNDAAERAFDDVMQSGNAQAADMLRALRAFLRDNDIMAYITHITVRVLELRRVLKPTGSIYLHCDPTASHYLKVMMDAVFGAERFVNEISWKRSSTRSSISRSLRRAHDVILFYAKTPDHKFNLQYRPLSEGSVELYKHTDEHGTYQLVPLLVSGRRNGATGEIWRGVDPNKQGKRGMHWVTTPENLDKYDGEGRVVWPQKAGGTPRLKYYLEENPGVPLDDIWYDIPLISSSSREALGYPTQKPLALLERIIESSSDIGDVVLDPFCGCGTTVHAAEKLKRQWIGIDITHLSISLIEKRLRDASLASSLRFTARQRISVARAILLPATSTSSSGGLCPLSTLFRKTARKRAPTAVSTDSSTSGPEPRPPRKPSSLSRAAAPV